VHFRILILKFYLQSNAEKGTSSHGILGDWPWQIWKRPSFHQSCKLIPVQSVISNSRRFHSYTCYRPKMILYMLQTQAALYGYHRPVVCSKLTRPTLGMYRLRCHSSSLTICNYTVDVACGHFTIMQTHNI